MTNKLSWTLEMLCKAEGIKLTPEHRFHPKRRWRFDYADLEHKIAIELEGGVWIRGRHNRAAGYRADTIKYNQATALGWKVLRYCTVEDITTYFLDDYATCKS